jgi:hypothetical protein
MALVAQPSRTRGEDAARLHHDYARAGKVFEVALAKTLREHTRGDRPITHEDLADLLGLL